MNCEILAVGTELLLGDILNSNAQYISRELSLLGMNVYYQSVVGDNRERLKSALEIAFSRADMVITTGGLGPTDDDLTKETAAEYFNVPLYTDEESLSRIEAVFKGLNATMTDNNRKQALALEGSIILKNEKGTAPGTIFEKDGKTIILLPGPPFEMNPMFESGVIHYLEKKSECVFLSKNLNLCGIGESAAAHAIKDILDEQDNPSIAPYAKANGVTFRITARAESKERAKELIEPVSKRIYDVLGEYIYGEDEDTLANSVIALLKANNLTIAAAESCTGGLVSSLLTDVPGSSQVFLEGCVTYSNDAKIRRINVKYETLEKFGAVSAECAEEMAAGIAKNSGSDIGVSLTGIAGPSGGTDKKPVGLIYISLFIKGRIITRELNLSGDRTKIRNRAAVYALDFIRRNIK